MATRLTEELMAWARTHDCVVLTNDLDFGAILAGVVLVIAAVAYADGKRWPRSAMVACAAMIALVSMRAAFTVRASLPTWLEPPRPECKGSAHHVGSR